MEITSNPHLLLYEEMYSKLLNQAILENSDLVICGVARVSETGRELNAYIPLKTSFEEILKNAYAWNKVYKKEIFEKILFPVGKHYEDIFTTPKLYLNSKKISLIKEKLYYYVEREGSITGKKDNQKIVDIIDAYLELKKYIQENKYNDLKIEKQFNNCLKLMKNNFILRTISGYSIEFFNKNEDIIVKKFKELDFWNKEDYIKFYFSKYVPKNYIKNILRK